MINILKCLMIIIGTFIGAGFASGQEIATFFNRFMDYGMYGLLITSLIFGLVIFFVMNLVSKYNFENYEKLIGNNKIAMNIMRAFTFICFCIMISGVGSYGEQLYGISFWSGALFTSIICFISFLFKFNGLEKINNILVPLIILGTILIGIYPYNVNEFTMQAYELPYFMGTNWFLSALLYAGYNSILLIPILLELNIYKLSKKDIICLSVLSALIIAVLGGLIFSAINIYFPEIMGVEMPTLVLANICGGMTEVYYKIIIIFAIFTTAFSSGYAFLKLNSEKNYFRNTVLMCFFAVLFSRIGFSDLINFFFPLFGYLGIFQIFIILGLNRKTKEKGGK